MLPPRLAPIVDALVAATPAGDVSIDAIGDAIGTTAVSTDDVDAIFTALEARGLHIVAPAGQRGVANLRKVLEAARALRGTLGRPPTLDELARETGIDVVDVRHAVALGRVMGR